MPEDQKPERYIDERIKHFEMVQEVVKRMAQNSFVIKGWMVTLVTVVIAVTQDSGGHPEHVWIAFIPTFIFWVLDGYFLDLERRFRKLSDAIGVDIQTAAGSPPERKEGEDETPHKPVPLFSMNYTEYDKDIIFHQTIRRRNIVAIPGTLTILIGLIWLNALTQLSTG